jgi:voltage-gated potassium channel
VAQTSGPIERSIRARLRAVIEGEDARWSRRFELAIQALILFSIISLTIETIPGLDPRLSRFLSLAEVGIVAIFTVEYLVRLFAARSPLRYATSFWGVVDLTAILPYYLALGLDLRGVRAFRLLRLLWVFKLFRYGHAGDRLAAAFQRVRGELAVFLVVALIVIYLSAVGLYYFENEAQPDVFGSIPQALWWAIVTLTTVGYGDAVPITVGGRVFTGFVLFLGLGAVAVPTGLMASALTEIRREEKELGAAAVFSQRSPTGYAGNKPDDATVLAPDHKEQTETRHERPD